MQPNRTMRVAPDMRGPVTKSAIDQQRLMRLLTVACFGALGILSVLFVLTVAIAPAESAVVSPQPVYAPDDYRMIQWCSDASAVYASPDGRLWTWIEGWRPVKSDYAAAEFCEAPSLQLR